LFIKQYHLTGN